MDTDLVREHPMLALNYPSLLHNPDVRILLGVISLAITALVVWVAADTSKPLAKRLGEHAKHVAGVAEYCFLSIIRIVVITGLTWFAFHEATGLSFIQFLAAATAAVCLAGPRFTPTPADSFELERMMGTRSNKTSAFNEDRYRFHREHSQGFGGLGTSVDRSSSFSQAKP